MTTMRSSHEETNNIVKIFKSLKESGLLIKGVSETFKNEEKQQKDGFPRLLLGAFHIKFLLKPRRTMTECFL